MTMDPLHPAPGASMPPAGPGPSVAAGATGDIGPALAEFEAKEIVTGWPVWRVGLYADRLRLHPPDGSLPFDVHRPEWEQRAEVHDAMLAPRTMVLKLDKSRPFRLDRPSFDALGRWIGNARMLRTALKRRMGWMLPIALIFIVGALPMGSADDPPASRKPFDPMWLGLGLMLGVIWVLWKIRPHPILFVLDSLWLLAVAAISAYRLALGWSWFWFALLLLQLSLAYGGIRLYARFRDTRLNETADADDNAVPAA